MKRRNDKDQSQIIIENQSVDKKKENLTHHFFLFLSLIGIFYTINSDVIQTNPFSPFYMYFSDNNSIHSSEIISEMSHGQNSTKLNSKNEHTYILALDTSLSILNAESFAPDWYRGVIKETNNLITQKDKRIQESIVPGPKELVKATLYKLLLDIKDTPNLKFVIWKFGNSGEEEILFPPQNGCTEIGVTQQNILGAIEKIERTEIDSKFTDFKSFFNRLLKNYKLDETKAQPNEKPKCNLIVISDLIHDTNISKQTFGNGIHDYKKYKEDSKKEMENLIAELDKSNVFAKFITLSEFPFQETSSENVYSSEQNDQVKFSILKIFQSQFDRERFRTISITDSLEKILYDKVTIKSFINFRYTNPNYIEDSTYEILISDSGEYEIGLTNLSSDVHDQLYIQYQILTSDGQLKNPKNSSEGVLYPGRSYKLSLMQKNERVILTYKGPLPRTTNIPKFQFISTKNGKKIYEIPIKFEKGITITNTIIFYILMLVLLVPFFKPTIRKIKYLLEKIKLKI